MAGIFFAVVGASGVGKDSVLNEARSSLEKTGNYYFPMRLITRPPDDAGEEHEAISIIEFKDLIRDDRFSLWWTAHDLHYALPEDVYAALRSGKHVVANISRRMVKDAQDRFKRVEVLEITASNETIKNRLMSRGRESEEEVMLRLLREVSQSWSGDSRVTKIENDGPLEHAAKQFVQKVISLSAENAQQVQRA